MKNLTIVRYQKRLDNIFKMVSLLPEEDLELKSHWSRYLCVLVSGFIEVSVRSLYSDFTRKKSIPVVGNYVENGLKQLQNPKMEKILILTRQFSPEWEEKLRKATEGELKDAIDSIVENRNKIAHGEDVGVSYARVRNYYKNVVKVLELLDKQLNT